MNVVVAALVRDDFDVVGGSGAVVTVGCWCCC